MKNYMGVVEKRDTLHQDIDTCLADLTRFMKPRICVLDAMRVLTAHGPVGGNLQRCRGQDHRGGRRGHRRPGRPRRRTAGQEARRYGHRRQGREGRPGQNELPQAEPAGAGRFMSKRGRASATTHARRVTQALFLLLFLGLLVAASLRTGEAARPLLKLFFLFDPLLLLATWLSAHGCAGRHALVARAGGRHACLLGRVFCGWACPLGTVHALAGWVFHRRRQGQNPAITGRPGNAPSTISWPACW